MPPGGAGYHAGVAGLDEASARSALAAMQDRLARDPLAALGLGPSASADDVRAAFLALTKQFHPVRFGRMASDIQKLSNEVFLALRSAHDALAKSLRRRTGPIPTIAAAQQQTGAVRVAPSALGSQVMGPAGQATRPTAVPPKPPRMPGDSTERPPVVSRTMTPASGVGVRPVVPVARPAGPVISRTASGVPTPLAGTPTVPHAGVPARPNAPQARPAPATMNEAGVLELLQRQQWNEARTALHQLIAREPQSKRFRALMSYARGREAQLDRRLDDARVELQDALDLDPELQLAKTALTELFTRRK